jgi:hypothetical protein
MLMVEESMEISVLKTHGESIRGNDGQQKIPTGYH